MQIQVGAVSVMSGFLFLVWEKGEHLDKGKFMPCLEADRGRVEFFWGLLFFNCLHLHISLRPKGHILGWHLRILFTFLPQWLWTGPPTLPLLQGVMHNGVWRCMTGKVPGSDPSQWCNLKHGQPASWASVSSPMGRLEAFHGIGWDTLPHGSSATYVSAWCSLRKDHWW